MGKYWWDPTTGIEFAEVETDNGPLNLTFLKPCMYRSRRGSQLLRILAIPWTACELLSTKPGESVTLVANPDLTRMHNPKSRFWKILFLQTDVSEKLYSLQEINVNIFDVAEFYECIQIIDKKTKLRHPVKITINKADEVEFPEEILQYERISRFLEEKAIL